MKNNFITPQLKKLHQGKVRDSFLLNKDRRIIITTDRLSCFDEVLPSGLPSKGGLLNQISNFWFNKTANIIKNHLDKMIAPNILLVKEAEAIKIEMIVRQYLTGSMWRKYQNGERTFCGITVKDGMMKNDRFDRPIVTPTTKESSDRDISPEEIINTGLVSADTYKKMEELSIELFLYGQSVCKDRGLVLVDTKYEFGFIDHELCLIDEIHTPDSSRFWLLEDYNDDQESVTHYDKEYARSWLLNNSSKDIPESILENCLKRYEVVYERLLSQKYDRCYFSTSDIKEALVANNIIKNGYISLIISSKEDISYAMKFKELFQCYDIMVDVRICSLYLHENHLKEILENYNNAVESGAVILIGNEAEKLVDMLSTNLTIPIINCSSLTYGSNSDIKFIGEMALKSLNLVSVRNILEKKRLDENSILQQDDFVVRSIK